MNPRFNLAISLRKAQVAAERNGVGFNCGLELFELLLSAVILHRRISQAANRAKNAPQENAGHVALVGSPETRPTGRSRTDTVTRQPPASAVALHDASRGSGDSQSELFFKRFAGICGNSVSAIRRPPRRAVSRCRTPYAARRLSTGRPRARIIRLRVGRRRHTVASCLKRK
jgi:hypothetical protein